MKTAISIPDPLFQASERLARRMGISRSELFQMAMRAFLRDHTDSEVTEALNSVYASAGRTASLDPFLGDLQGLTIREDEW